MCLIKFLLRSTHVDNSNKWVDLIVNWMFIIEKKRVGLLQLALTRCQQGFTIVKLIYDIALYPFIDYMK